MFLFRRLAVILLLFVGCEEIPATQTSGLTHKVRSDFTTDPEEMNLAKQSQNSKNRIAVLGENHLNSGRTKIATTSE